MGLWTIEDGPFKQLGPWTLVQGDKLNQENLLDATPPIQTLGGKGV